MAKNPRRQLEKNPSLKPENASTGSSVSRRGLKVIGVGIGMVVIGFYILTLTDPAGQNWASTLSPALLVLGYTLIGIGIVLPDPVSSNLPTAE